MDIEAKKEELKKQFEKLGQQHEFHLAQAKEFYEEMLRLQGQYKIMTELEKEKQKCQTGM
jgi:hypothetical protein